MMSITITNNEKKCEFINVSKESVEKIYAILLAEYNNPGNKNRSTTVHPIESYCNKYRDYCDKCDENYDKEICNECNQSHYYEIPSKFVRKL